MITKWKVFNFKSIREETELDLGPLTIFAGENSSGKSTFIQSILLVAQTLAYKVGSRSVVLNGALASLGQFDDLKSNGGESDQITIEWTCQPLSHRRATSRRMSQLAPRGGIYYRQLSSHIQEITCKISFDSDPSGHQQDLFQLQPRLFAADLSCLYKDEDNPGQKISISIHHSGKTIAEIEGISDEDEIDDQERAGIAYTIKLDNNSMDEVREDFRTAKPEGCVFRHFLPERIIYTIDTVEEDANLVTMMLQGDRYRMSRFQRSSKDIYLSKEVIDVLHDILKDKINFEKIGGIRSQRDLSSSSESDGLTVRSLFNRIRRLPEREYNEINQALNEHRDLSSRIHSAMKSSIIEGSGTREVIQYRPHMLITQATGYLDDFFTSSLKYLGPLRDAPKPLYPLASAADPYDVGLRGEYTASILELHKNQEIVYIPSATFKDPINDYEPVFETLEKAVIDWLQYLDVASSVRSRDLGKLGHELKVGLPNSRESHDLMHVGVGVSQVLPILVMCLLAEPDYTLVFEQPELHLHPKVQALLGDFFLSMALCKKQCIVETHSEYLIDRLRFRIAEASQENRLNNEAKIYFVEKPSQGSTFREVKINEYGAILDWPEGFFDQSQQQSEDILIAATKKHAADKSEERG